MKLIVAFVVSHVCFVASAQRNWVESEVKYPDAAGRIIKIENSYPKGGGALLTARGKEYSYVIFFTRIVNESSSAVKLKLRYPTDSLPIFASHGSYIKLVLPADSMTNERIQLGDYGLRNLQSVLDAADKTTNELERTISPQGEYLFNTVIFIHQARGTARTALVVKGSELFYSIKIDPASASLLCGRIEFKQ